MVGDSKLEIPPGDGSSLDTAFPGNKLPRSVLWVGGSACSGKTAVARRLASDFRLALYSCDDHFENHRDRANPERHAAFRRLAERPVERLWDGSSELQAEALLGFYRDEMELILEDLQGEVAAQPLLVEGTGLLPELLLPTRTSSDRALWLISTGEWRRREYPRRGTWVSRLLEGLREPEAAFERWMARDDLLAEAMVASARRLGGRVLVVDGHRSLAETTSVAARLLGLSGAGAEVPRGGGGG